MNCNQFSLNSVHCTYLRPVIVIIIMITIIGAVEEQPSNAEATFPPQNSRLRWQSVAGGI